MSKEAVNACIELWREKFECEDDDRLDDIVDEINDLSSDLTEAEHEYVRDTVDLMKESYEW